MFWKWFWKVLAILLVLSLLIVCGMAIYRFGFTHGAMIKLQSIESNLGVPVPLMVFYHLTLILFPFLVMLFFFAFFLIIIGGIHRHHHNRSWESLKFLSYDEIRQHWKRGHYPHHWRGRCWHPKEKDQEKSDEQDSKDDKVEDTDLD